MDALFQNTKNTSLLLRWINAHSDEATPLFTKYRKELKALPETYVKWVKQLHLSDLAKEWIEAFPMSQREAQAIIFFEDYQPSHRTLLESICSLPGLNEKKLLDILSKKGLPVFADKPLAELLPLLNGRHELLKSIAELTLNPKDLNLLDGFIRKNPSLALDLIACLLEKKDFLPIALSHLIALKCDDAAIWKKAIELTAPESLHLLIPFYRNYRLVEFIYGDKAEAETKKWAKAIRKQKLEPEEIEIIRNILSRNKLRFTPLRNLHGYLEAMCQEKVTDECFHAMVSTLLLSIQIENSMRLYHFEILLKILKLGMKAKLHTLNGFSMLYQILPFASPLVFEGGSFDPLYYHLQTMPLVDYGTEALYNQWIGKRNEVFGAWKEVYIKDNLKVRDIKENAPLKTLPYELMQASCRLSDQYKLIAEKYIENKITKKEFHLEIRYLSLETARIFESQELMAHEDPCIICIHDLSPFLNIRNKRERAYEAFFYILNQRKHNQKTVETHKSYLETRKKTSDLIIHETTRVAKTETLYQTFICSLDQYIVNFSKFCSLEGVLKLDPIIDAFDMEEIDPLKKIHLLNLWEDKLEPFKSPHALYYIKRIRSRIEFEKTKLDKEAVFAALKERSELLRISRGFGLEDRQTEGIMIFQDANIYLNKDQVVEIKKLLDRTLGKNTPIAHMSLYNNIMFAERPLSKKLPLISYLESLSPPDAAKVTDQNLQDRFYNAIVGFTAIAEQGELGGRYAFGAVLHLIKLGIEFGVLTSSYFTLLGRMAAKAPQYLLEVESKVVFDPYIDLLHSLSDIDLGSEGSTNELNRQIDEFFLYWNKQLGSTSLGLESTVLETMPYDIIRTTRYYAREFGSEIERFIFNEISGDELKNKLGTLSASAFVNIQNYAFTRHTDPCSIALKMLFFHLKNKDTRVQAYAALNQLCIQWAKNFAVEPGYIKVYREYLGARRATEDVIQNQIEYNKSTFLNLSIADHIRLIFNPSIPELIHLVDPIADAIEIEGLPLMDKLFLLHEWEMALNQSDVPTAKYHAKTILSYIFCEAKKVNEAEAEKHLTQNVNGLVQVREFLDPRMLLEIRKKLNYIGSLTLSPEKRLIVLDPTNEPPVVSKTKVTRLLKILDPDHQT